MLAPIDLRQTLERLDQMESEVAHRLATATMAVTAASEVVGTSVKAARKASVVGEGAEVVVPTPAAIEAAAVTFCAKKVAAASGDARRGLTYVPAGHGTQTSSLLTSAIL